MKFYQKLRLACFYHIAKFHLQNRKGLYPKFHNTRLHSSTSALFWIIYRLLVSRSNLSFESLTPDYCSVLKSDPERPSHEDRIHFIVYNSTTSCVRFFINFFIACYIFGIHLFSPDITVLYRILTVSIPSWIRNTTMILLNVTHFLSYSSLCSKMMKTTLMT